MKLFYILLVLLVTTRLFAAAAVRLKQPALVGELAAGIALGMLVNHYNESLPILSSLSGNEVFTAITELGVFFLMLMAGLELRPRDFVKGSTKALAIAAGGMLVPFTVGAGLAWVMLPESGYRLPQAIFVGTALSITAVPVASKVLIDLGQLKTEAGKTIISAAVIDDVLSLGLLAVLTSLLNQGEWPGLMGLVELAVMILAFFTIVSLLGRYLIPVVMKRVGRADIEELEFSLFLIIAFAFAVIAELLGVHFILGAFAAGLFFTRRVTDEKIYADVKRNVSAVTTGFLAPIFFASMGLHIEISSFTQAPLFLAAFIAIAVAAKILGAGIPAYFLGSSMHQASIIGVGMSARGAVELVVADIALRAGLFDHPSPTPAIVEQLFPAVIVMAVLTTVIAPIGLRALLSRKENS